MNPNRRHTRLNCSPVVGKFPTFEKPQPIGYFSITSEREYDPTSSQLQYFKPPRNFPLDLKDGVEVAIRKPESAYSEGIDHLLKFIYDNHERLFKPPVQNNMRRPIVGAEFVCYRGVLRRLMCVPYENREPLTICVTHYMGTFYLNKPDTRRDKYKRFNETQQQRNMCSWGFKFEQYCVSRSPYSTPVVHVPVNECTEFSCVFKTRLGGLEILYGAEMDAVVSEEPVLDDENSRLNSLKFIELKVRQGLLNRRQADIFHRFRTRDWWCQSFLVGIEDIYVGMRTENGLVRQIERMEVRALPKMGASYWDPSACALFAIEFFMCLKSIMSEVNCPYTTFIFYYNPEKSCVTYECFEGKTTHSFLPDWYILLLNRKYYQSTGTM